MASGQLDDFFARSAAARTDLPGFGHLGKVGQPRLNVPAHDGRRQWCHAKGERNGWPRNGLSDYEDRDGKIRIRGWRRQRPAGTTQARATSPGNVARKRRKEEHMGPVGTEPLARHALAFVLAGGRGSRLLELTDRRAKPAVYFGGKSRIIDFALSNAVNSGIRRIAVATQYKAHSLIRHL